MIHDKDYMMRQIRQLSEFLQRLMLGNNEGKPDEIQLVLETQMKDIFGKRPNEVLKITSSELMDFVQKTEEKYHAEYYELLGHLFYYQFQQDPNNDYAENALKFYQLYLEKSMIFSIPVIERIKEANGLRY